MSFQVIAIAYISIMSAGLVWLVALRRAERRYRLSPTEREWLEDVIRKLDRRKEHLRLAADQVCDEGNAVSGSATRTVGAHQPASMQAASAVA